MKGVEQAVVVETLPLDDKIPSLNASKIDANLQNLISGEDATVNAPLDPTAAPGTQQQRNPPQRHLNPPSPNEDIKEDQTIKSTDPAHPDQAVLKGNHADHHHKRSRSRSRDDKDRYHRARDHRSRSRSRSRGRRERSRSREEHHHRHHRNHHDEEEARRRGRSPATHHHRDDDDHEHHHHSSHHHNSEHNHQHQHHRRKSRSRSRSRDRKRSRSRSPSPQNKHHRHHHHHHDRHHHHPKTDDVAAVSPNLARIATTTTTTTTATDVIPSDDVPPPDNGTPTKAIVRHESTLVALRPSASPRSFPISTLELAAEALKSPVPAGSPYNEPLSLGPLVFGAAQAKGMRPYMEDRHIIEEPLVPRGSSGAPLPDDTPRSFAAVYDGHNGTLAADHAAERLHFILAAEPAFRTCTGDGPPAAIHREGERISAALIHAFEATDKEILTRCRTENGRGGATGVVILRIGEMLYAAHCGDSRAVLCRGGEPLRLTEDHKPNLPRERKRVEDLGGRVDFARCWRVIVDPGGGRPASGLAVSRSFGDPDFKEPLHLVTATPDVMSERLTEEDTFVILASDGLWDVMTDKRACEVVKAKIATAMANASGGGEKVSLSLIATVAAQALVQSALNAGTMDNVTAVVGLLKWS